MMELRRLVSFEGSWERPAVHRFLELLYRTLPLVQLGPAVCELIFEKFHELTKQEVGQSNSRNPAGYYAEMEGHRALLETAFKARRVWDSCMVAAWEKWRALEGCPIPQTGSAPATLACCRRELASKKALHTVRSSTEDLCRREAPNSVLAFCGRATHPQRSFLIREGSTLSIAEEREASLEERSSESTDSDAQFFARVHSNGKIDGELHVAIEKWKLPPMALSVLVQDELVAIDEAAGVEIARADRVRQIAFVLPCVALRVPDHAPWLAGRSLVRRATRLTCHAPVRTGGAGGAGWDLD